MMELENLAATTEAGTALAELSAAAGRPGKSGGGRSRRAPLRGGDVARVVATVEADANRTACRTGDESCRPPSRRLQSCAPRASATGHHGAEDASCGDKSPAGQAWPGPP